MCDIFAVLRVCLGPVLSPVVGLLDAIARHVQLQDHAMMHKAIDIDDLGFPTLVPCGII